MITEQARSDVYLNGQQAGQELENLAKKAEKLKKELADLRKANDKTGFDKKNKELQETNKAMKELQKQTFDVGKVLKNLDSASLDDLYKAQRRLNREMRKMDPGSREYKEASKQSKKLSDRINQLKGNVKATHSPLSKLKNLLIGIGAVAGIKQLITSIARVRMEFEKYGAILEVALGNQEAANREMRMLSQFASTTPFQLQNLTDAFVKLTNQGFKPSRDEMTKLGDLSAAMGKEFDQLAEAIIDAQTGEFERLKEFGIRASKEGDKVTFMFREQKKEVAFTAHAIREYILQLGEMEGIQGSMAKVSETLGGKVSNLKDSWDNLMNSLGAQTSGIMVSVINWLIDLTNGLALAAKGIRQIKKDIMDDMTRENLSQALDEIRVIEESLVKHGMDAAAAEKRAVELYQDSVDTRIDALKTELQVAEGSRIEAVESQIELLEREREALKNHLVEVEILHKKQADAYAAAQKERAEEEEKQRQAALKEAVEKANQAYDEEMVILKQGLLDKRLTQEEYEQEVLALKIASLNLEIELRKQFGQSAADLESELLQLRIDTINKESEAREDAREKEKKAAEKQAEEEKQRREEEFREAQRMLQQKYNTYMSLTQDMGSTFSEYLNYRKDAESEYHKEIGRLNEELKQEKISQEEYEAQLAALRKTRMEEEEAASKNFRNSMLLSILDYLRKYAHMKIAEITIGSLASAESIATFGIAGIAKASILTALVEGAFAVAKSKLTQHYEGRFPVTGDQDNRTYMAAPAGDATTGIYRTPSLVAERGDEMIIDSPTLTNISLKRPDLLRDVMNMRVPQFASGRMPAGVSESDESSRMLINAITQLTSLLKSGIYAKYDDKEARQIRDRITLINNIENSIRK